MNERAEKTRHDPSILGTKKHAKIPRIVLLFPRRFGTMCFAAIRTQRRHAMPKKEFCIEVLDSESTPHHQRSDGKRYVSRYKDAGVWSAEGMKVWRSLAGVNKALTKLQSQWAYFLKHSGKRLQITSPEETLPDYRGLLVKVVKIDDSLMGDEEHAELRKACLGKIGRADDVRLVTHPEYQTVNPDMYLVEIDGEQVNLAPHELELAE